MAQLGQKVGSIHPVLSLTDACKGATDMEDVIEAMLLRTDHFVSKSMYF